MASQGLSFPNNLRSIQDDDNDDDDKKKKNNNNNKDDDKNNKIPKFSDMVNIIYEKSIYRNKLIINNQANLSGRTLYVKGYRSEVYTNILKFLRQLMIINADPNAMVDEFLFDEFDSENKIFESKTRSLVKDWISEQWTRDQLFLQQQQQQQQPQQQEEEEEIEIEKMDIEEDNQLTEEREGVCHVYLSLLEKGLSNEGLVGK